MRKPAARMLKSTNSSIAKRWKRLGPKERAIVWGAVLALTAQAESQKKATTRRNVEGHSHG